MLLIRAIFAPAHYRPMTAWGPVQTLLVTIVAYALARLVATYAVTEIWIATKQVTSAMTRQDLVISAILSASFWLSVDTLACVLLAGAAWLAARRGGMQATDVLALRMPLCGYRVLLLVGVLMAIGLAAELAFHFARYAALPARWGLMGWASIGRAAGWPLAVLSVGIVRPIAEELLFRGFLLPALARSRLGFWGAGLVTSALFAAAHYYLFTPDVLMLVGFFLGGLFLVWTLGVTGSLWVPMAIHMSYNLLALLWLRLWGPL